MMKLTYHNLQFNLITTNYQLKSPKRQEIKMNTTFNINKLKAAAVKAATEKAMEVAVPDNNYKVEADSIFNTIAAQLEVIATATKLHEEADTVELTVAPTDYGSQYFALHKRIAMTDAEIRQVDSAVARVVQQLMAEKIEEALAILAESGVELTPELTAKYTVPLEDQL